MGDIVAGINNKPVLFSLGKTAMTPGFIASQNGDVCMAGFVSDILMRSRHQKGDWGILGDMDKSLNDAAVKNGERIVSKYRVPSLKKARNGRVVRGEAVEVYVVTEWDRSVTTVLCCYEY